MKIFIIINLIIVFCIVFVPLSKSYAETFLTEQQARELIWKNTQLKLVDVTLTKEQMKSIRKSSGTRVRHKKIKAWKTPDGGWFILDQVIGKHENIDIAVGLTSEGKVKDVEILTYRETYGGQVRNKKWLAQFFGKDSSRILKLDRDIQNISGATLSCRHVTDGVNRLTHTWNQVLQYL